MIYISVTTENKIYSNLLSSTLNPSNKTPVDNRTPGNKDFRISLKVDRMSKLGEFLETHKSLTGKSYSDILDGLVPADPDELFTSYFENFQKQVLNLYPNKFNELEIIRVLCVRALKGNVPEDPHILITALFGVE